MSKLTSRSDLAECGGGLREMALGPFVIAEPAKQLAGGQPAPSFVQWIPAPRRVLRRLLVGGERLTPSAQPAQALRLQGGGLQLLGVRGGRSRHIGQLAERIIEADSRGEDAGARNSRMQVGWRQCRRARG